MADHWSTYLKSAVAPPPATAGFNPTRWGQSVPADLVIPAASVVPVTIAFVQILQVTEPKARVWSLDLALEWLNFQAGVAPETLTAQVTIQTGVGAGKINRVTTMTVNTVLSLAALTVPNLPAQTIYVAMNLSVTPVAGAARVFRASLGAMVAPTYGGPQ